MATSDEAQAYLDAFNEWQTDYGIGDFIENTPENWERVQAMDPHLVWTDHGTCEDPQVTSGAHMYSGRCCWDTYGWYVAEKPWEDGPGGADGTYISYKTTFYDSCPSCNPDGENDEGAENCPGDTEIESEPCDGGWVQYYFD